MTHTARLLARDLSAVLDALSQNAGGVVLRTGDGTVVWQGGGPLGAAAELVFETAAGSLVLTVPAGARAYAEVAAAAVRQLVSNRRALGAPSAHSKGGSFFQERKFIGCARRRSCAWGSSTFPRRKCSSDRWRSKKI